MKNPLVSVLLPVHNAERTIYETIQSLLYQTYTNFELIIIDDGSTDKTKDIIKRAKDHRIKLIINKTRKRISTSLNQGLKSARGVYIARMDADDIASNNRFQVQVEFLERHPKVMLVGSWAEIVDFRGKKIGIKKFPVTYKRIREVILRYNPFIHPTVMLRRSVISNLGKYNESLNGAEDYDLFLRIAAKHECLNIGQPLLKYRVATTSISGSETKIVEYQALRTRIKALIEYRYPWWQGLYLAKPLLSFFIPTKIKNLFIKYEND